MGCLACAVGFDAAYFVNFMVFVVMFGCGGCDCSVNSVVVFFIEVFSILVCLLCLCYKFVYLCLLVFTRLFGGCGSACVFGRVGLCCVVVVLR